MWRSALRFVLAATAAGFIWFLATPSYNRFLAVASQPLLSIDPRLRGVEVRGIGQRIHARGSETRPELPRVIIPASELTYNLVLFAGLFGSDRKPFRDRGWRRLAIALLILVVTHVVAVAVSTEAAYATKLKEWSENNYSDPLQDFWSAAEYSYRLAGMFAIAFACWWFSAPSAAQIDRAQSAV